MADEPGRPSTTDLLRYFLYLGSLGFGGPVALVGYMQRDLVERGARGLPKRST
jgi:chromate transporter